MSAQTDWTVWLLAAAVIILFGWFFWHAGAAIFSAMYRLGQTIQNWPQIRRAMTEAEAKSGGRYPLWYRALRGFFIVAAIALSTYVIWRKIL